MAVQVFSEQEVDFGRTVKFFWNWAAPNEIVPPHRVLEIETLTLNYFPAGGGTIGRADIAGRDASNSAVWRVQIIYVEPKKTVHLPFPRGLRLSQGATWN